MKARHLDISPGVSPYEGPESGRAGEAHRLRGVGVPAAGRFGSTVSRSIGVHPTSGLWHLPVTPCWAARRAPEFKAWPKAATTAEERLALLRLTAASVCEQLGAPYWTSWSSCREGCSGAASSVAGGPRADAAYLEASAPSSTVIHAASC